MSVIKIIFKEFHFKKTSQKVSKKTTENAFQIIRIKLNIHRLRMLASRRVLIKHSIKLSSCLIQSCLKFWHFSLFIILKVVKAASPALLRVIAMGAFLIYCTVSMISG